MQGHLSACLVAALACDVARAQQLRSRAAVRLRGHTQLSQLLRKRQPLLVVSMPWPSGIGPRA